ncbi:hypothetical protein ACLOJK_007478 [Asimina triloba]
MRIAPTKGSDARNSKKIAREKSGQFFIPKADHIRTPTEWDIKEIFKWLYIILEDLLLVESRVIRENVALGLELELDNEGKDPAELKLWRELKDLEERIRQINRCSTWSEYRYHDQAFEEEIITKESRRGLEMELAKAHMIRDVLIAEVAEAR